MPGLRHLQLVGNELTNKGLHAILDGCPYLESLDLRKCFNVDLDEEEMGQRCGVQIEDLKCPNDSIHDYQFATEMNDHGAPKYNCLYPPRDYNCFDIDFDVFSLYGGDYDMYCFGDSESVVYLLNLYEFVDTDDDDDDYFDYAPDDDAFDEYDIHLEVKGC